MSKNLKTASQDIVVSNTLSEYRRCAACFHRAELISYNCLSSRLWEQFKQFCCDIDRVKHPNDIDDLYYPDLPADFPEWIAMWIMDRYALSSQPLHCCREKADSDNPIIAHRADDIDIFTGKAKEVNVSRVTYATAQKMHAAISHKYGRDHGLGTQPWLEDSLHPGHFRGNPSLSVTVSQYMISLGRRKVNLNQQLLQTLTTDMLIRFVRVRSSPVPGLLMSRP